MPTIRVSLRTLLVVGAFAWPLLLASATAARIAGRARIWSTGIYLAASAVCHQRPDRSFFTAAVKWPVCGRCAGLYLSAPFGALGALWFGARRRAADHRVWLVVASLPTAATLVLEWLHLAPVTTMIRAIAAVPLGVALAWVLVSITADSPEPNRVN